MAYDTSYYDNAISQYDAYAEEQAKKKKQEAQTTRDTALRQAYISRLQDQNKIENNLAKAGIRGGATETANLGLATNYGNSRASTNAAYSNAIGTIDSDTEANKLSNKQTVESQRNEYLQNREAEDRANAREDAQNAKNERINYFTAVYSRYNKAKDLKAALKKATTLEEKQVIYARMGYLKGK